MTSRLAYLALAITFIATPALANDETNVYNRNTLEQQRILADLKSGQLDVWEASTLERDELHMELMERLDAKNGYSPKELAQIAHQQNLEDHRMTIDEHDPVTGNPNSVYAKRMEQVVQRDVNQQKRIAQGVKSGSLTDAEAAKLERGQFKIDRTQWALGRNGFISHGEQKQINALQNKQNLMIKQLKSNAKKHK